MTSDQPHASKLCIKVHLSVQQTDNALLTRNKTFITHFAGFACFNVCAHLDDAIMLSAFGLCITQPQALLHHPCAHTNTQSQLNVFLIYHSNVKTCSVSVMRFAP